MIETPLDAIDWLKQKSSRIMVGRDDYADVIQVIRNLIKDRMEVQRLVEQQIKQIYKLENPPKPKSKLRASPQPFGTEGNGILTFQIPPEERK